MQPEVLFLVVGGLIGIGIYGALRGRSAVAGILNLGFTGVAGLLSYYSFVEVGSAPWGVSYALSGALFFLLSMMAFRTGKRGHAESRG